MAETFERLDAGTKPNPFLDPAGGKKLIASAEKAFREQLAAENALLAK